MKVSYAWLKDYIEGELPSVEALGEALTMSSFEVESVEEILGDTVLNCAILPNRNHDCLSHKGIAREAALLFDLDLKSDKPEIAYPESKKLTVTLEDEFCTRYTGAFIRNVKVGPSPEWLQKRLQVIGQRPINNIVDATNYVMFSLGQPLHAFDVNTLEKKEESVHIKVALAKKEESMDALDNKTYTLPLGTPLIVDQGNGAILGIAGIKGGKHSEITPQTKDIVLEAANFNPVLIRQFSKALNLRTDASVRFENGISASLTMPAMQTLISLILDIAKGEKTEVEGIVDIYPQKEVAYKVGVSKSEIENLLGTNLSGGDIEAILKRAGFEYTIISPRKKILELAPTYTDVPYKYGASVLRDQGKAFDCSSFIAHLFVEAGISIPRISVDQYVWGASVEEKDLKAGDVVYANTGVAKRVIYFETKEFLKGTKVPEGVDHCGLYLGDGKIIHATEQADKVIVENLKESAKFKNIVGYRNHIASEEERFVVTVPLERLDIRIKEDLIEEIGRVYGYRKITSHMPRLSSEYVVDRHFYYTSVIKNFLKEKGFSEVYTYTFVSKGEVEVLNPLASDKKYLRTNLSDALTKVATENIHYADLLALDTVRIFEIGKVFKKGGEYTSLALYSKGVKENKKKEKEEIEHIVEGLSSLLNISLPSVNDMPYEINLDECIQKLSQPEKYNEWVVEVNPRQVQKISPYPFALRDISLFVPSGTTSETVLSIIAKEAGALLVQSRLFDVFEKENALGVKQISYAFRLVFQSFEKTLSEDEINNVMENVVKALEREKDWKIR